MTLFGPINVIKKPCGSGPQISSNISRAAFNPSMDQTKYHQHKFKTFLKTMHNHKYFKLVSNPATQSSAHFGLESLTTAAQESRTMLA